MRKMENESIEKRVLHLREVEKLSLRQIAKTLKMGHRRVKRILEQQGLQIRSLPNLPLLEPFWHLIAHWYGEYPLLKAKQVYERLRAYSYRGSYATVARASRRYRTKKAQAYHPLQFLPGEEAQVDWFFFHHPRLGKLAGFLYVLAYSRYAWGVFYPRTAFEFFLAAHLECFRHLAGCARRHRYDNLKSVVLSRKSGLEYNPQFLDFARFFGFSIYVCSPYRGNEKGRVERLVRDVRTFLYGRDFKDLKDLNRQFQAFLKQRNETVHRSTGKSPKEMLSEERLLGLPKADYLPTRTIPAVVSKTALVEFDTNRYSVPTPLVSQPAQIVAYPDWVEIWVGGQRVARHPRSFEHMKLIEHPLHRQKLIEHTPHFKYERILQLIENMDPAFRDFLHKQETPEDKIRSSYELFQLLKTHSRFLLASALRELVSMGTFKIKAVRSLLHLPEPKEGDPLWPQNTELLHLNYQARNLKDYDPSVD